MVREGEIATAPMYRSIRKLSSWRE